MSSICYIEKKHNDDIEVNEMIAAFISLGKVNFYIKRGEDKQLIGKVISDDKDYIKIILPDEIAFSYGLNTKVKYYADLEKDKTGNMIDRYYFVLVDKDNNDVEFWSKNIDEEELNKMFVEYKQDELWNCNIPTLYMRYHEELYPDLIHCEFIEEGDYVDIRAAEDVDLLPGESTLINLGVSGEIPEGYFVELLPRSSTFERYGIIQTNSKGIIDKSYSGDNDIWKMPVYATRETHIKKNERIAQFRLVKKNKFRMKEIVHLKDQNRGGFGSTGVK